MGIKFLLIILGLILLSSTATATTVITQDNFENGVSSYWYRAMNNFSYSGNLSTNYSVSPTYSYRFELHSTDPKVEDSVRAELEGPAESALQERVYNFSVYLPKGGIEDYTVDNRNCGEVIIQWHNNPDPGEEWTRPPLALFTDTRSNGTGYYYLQRVWDDKPLSTDENLLKEGKVTEYDLGSYEGDKGKWVNWSFHVKWGWLASQNPKLEVYKNGVLVLNLTGLPNTMNDQQGVNQQFGLYKWEWDGSYPTQHSKLTKRVIYFDDVSVLQVDAQHAATPVILWSNPANISCGTVLNSTQLNAVAADPVTGNNLTGSFTYTPAAGTLLGVGTHALHVDFTPVDTANYTSASKDVTINVTSGQVTNGLVVYYDGSLSGNSLMDLSGNSNTGYARSVTQGKHPATGASYVNLNGVSSRINVSNNEQTNISSPLTVEFIGSINSFLRYGALVSKYSNGPVGWYLSSSSVHPYDKARFSAVMEEGPHHGYNSNISLVAGQVYDIVATYDNNVSRIYINGMESAGPRIWDSPTAGSPRNITIGAGYGLNYTNGSMYTFRLYNRALSHDEILQNYNNDLWRYTN